MVELGLINPAAEPRQVSGKGAVAVIDAQRAPGAVGMNVAARTAMQLADTHGIGWCAVRSISHAGAIGYYAQQVAQAGKVAIVMTASKPLMIYHGSKAEGVSTNPIAIAAPASNPGRPLLLDMSTASVALGKIMAARDAGQAIPPDWGVDADGRETTDPRKVTAVLPMAGPKGSGLSLMIEVLASVLVGNPLIAVALAAGGDPGGMVWSQCSTHRHSAKTLLPKSIASVPPSKDCRHPSDWMACTYLENVASRRWKDDHATGYRWCRGPDPGSWHSPRN